ncbi:MAG: glycosyltransferase family 4 protein [Clostridiaceae bacterium]
MKVVILIADSNSACPVPASRGGAVATLVEHIVEMNNEKNKIQLEIVSYFDEKAYELSKNYSNIEFKWIRVPPIIKILDSCIFFIMKTVFKKAKSISYRSTASLLTYIWKTSKYISCNEYDKIVIENNVLLFWIMKFHKNHIKFKGKYYFHLHNIPRVSGKCLTQIAGCNKYICVSDFVARTITSKDSAINIIDKSKIAIMYNCVDTKKFKNMAHDERIQQWRNKLNISQNDFLLIFVGRISKEKGVDHVIKALHLLKHKNVKLIIVGNTFNRGKIKSEFEEELQKLTLPVRDKVIYTGYIPQSELPILYSMANVAVLPSVWDEPAGLTMVEAMACGIPVITTNAGGIPEYTSENCSIVLDNDNELSQNIANCVDQLVDNPNLVDGMINNCVEHVRKNFDVENYLEDFIDILSSKS